ncbi:unnamed protein product [Chondrus crispus]|uniref:Reverse transcriptase RNase H-like domain-containing protein n=1 Tax=Chondrus crispus TaxID=2769 RepID=R7QGU1_CHOCR|nr:unnamed protein product [Chondrus crispus]CDF36681.1 unnamed protein product [Chondrus crispus]|eukprot:XP_005716500.1 unnamed protein product [Chondrus crispus]
MLKAGIITPLVSAWSFPIVILAQKDGNSRFSRMAENCNEKTTFVCRHGTFQFEVMPFGFMNAHSTFQRMTDQLFRELRFIRLLGHIVSAQGIEVHPEKFRAIQQQLAPTNTTRLRSFLGLAGHYRRFIPRLEISATPHAAMSVKRTLAWTPEMQKAFEDVKRKLTSPPVLAFPHFGKSFVAETDASSVSVGAVITQCKEYGKITAVQCAIRAMNDAKKKYSAIERGALAVIFALKKFRVYILSTQKCMLGTDHQALRYAFQKKDIHGRLATWMEFLAEYEFKVQYRPGNKNKAVDALNRLCVGRNPRGDPE